MLLILIPIAWLAVITLVVAACQSASRADMRLLAASAGDHSSTVAPPAAGDRQTGRRPDERRPGSLTVSAGRAL